MFEKRAAPSIISPSGAVRCSRPPPTFPCIIPVLVDRTTATPNPTLPCPGSPGSLPALAVPDQQREQLVSGILQSLSRISSRHTPHVPERETPRAARDPALFPTRFRCPCLTAPVPQLAALSGAQAVRLSSGSPRFVNTNFGIINTQRHHCFNFHSQAPGSSSRDSRITIRDSGPPGSLSYRQGHAVAQQLVC